MVALLSACGLPAAPSGPPELTTNPNAEAETPQEATRRPEQSAGLPRAPRNAAALKGMAAIEVTAALGTPTRLRRDKPAEIWQYVTAICVLDIFLYEEGGVQRVAHAQVRYPRGRSREQEAQDQCLGEIFRGQGQMQSRQSLAPPSLGDDAS